MSYVEVNTDLKTYFKSNWDFSIPVQFPGLDGLYTGETTPRIADKNSVNQWARWTVVYNETEQADLNAIPFEIKSGYVAVQLFSKIATVTDPQGTLLALADDLKDSHAYKNYKDIAFESVSISDSGEVGDGWYQVLVRIPWARFNT